jgi:hypothetical protein
MHTSPQQIRLSHEGCLHQATVSWRLEDDGFAVEIASDALGTSPLRTHASDAFEALCLLREQLEPQGWRVGVVGARIDVWPSGMARDQGGGQVAYRWEGRDPVDRVDTFAPTDPAAVVTVAE